MAALTPYQCGFDAFKSGVSHEGHSLPAGHESIDEWQRGWRDARTAKEQERYDRLTKPQAQAVMAETP